MSRDVISAPVVQRESAATGAIVRRSSDSGEALVRGLSLFFSRPDTDTRYRARPDSPISGPSLEQSNLAGMLSGPTGMEDLAAVAVEPENFRERQEAAWGTEALSDDRNGSWLPQPRGFF